MFVLQKREESADDNWQDRREADELVDLAQDVELGGEDFRVLYRETDDSQPHLNDGDIAYTFKGGPK